jgi:hypothetical protein
MTDVAQKDDVFVGLTFPQTTAILENYRLKGQIEVYQEMFKQLSTDTTTPPPPAVAVKTTAPVTERTGFIRRVIRLLVNLLLVVMVITCADHIKAIQPRNVPYWVEAITTARDVAVEYYVIACDFAVQYYGIASNALVTLK